MISGSTRHALVIAGKTEPDSLEFGLGRLLRSIGYSELVFTRNKLIMFTTSRELAHYVAFS